MQISNPKAVVEISRMTFMVFDPLEYYFRLQQEGRIVNQCYKLLKSAFIYAIRFYCISFVLS